MRISDWSSDVCSSDLGHVAVFLAHPHRILVLALGEIARVVQDRGAGDFLAADAEVELHPADGRQVVALEGEEQVVEQVLRGVLGRRLRSEEHTSELQSLMRVSYAVFCLKKTKTD